jgi:hypothetical protein
MGLNTREAEQRNARRRSQAIEAQAGRARRRRAAMHARRRQVGRRLFHWVCWHVRWAWLWAAGSTLDAQAFDQLR